MLVMPQGILPEAVWEAAENKEMEQVVELYGKVYHLWQVDRGDRLPMGEPQLMTSYTADGQLDFGKVKERDKRFGVDYEKKKKRREYIKEPEIHPGMFLHVRIASTVTDYLSQTQTRPGRSRTETGPGCWRTDNGSFETGKDKGRA